MTGNTRPPSVGVFLAEQLAQLFPDQCDIAAALAEYLLQPEWVWLIEWLADQVRESPVQLPHVRRAASDRQQMQWRERLDELRDMTYRQYLETDEWRRLRAIALDRAERRCQLCNRANGEINVHHRTYAKPRGEEDYLDLVALCRPCHATHHGKAPHERSLD